MLKPSCLKNNNKKRIEWIMTIKINLIFIIGEMMGYHKKSKSFLQGKKSSYKILNIFPLQSSITSRRKKKGDINLEKWWREGKKSDREYCAIKKTLKKKTVQFLIELKLKLLLSKYSIDNNDKITFKERK